MIRQKTVDEFLIFSKESVIADLHMKLAVLLLISNLYEPIDRLGLLYERQVSGELFSVLFVYFQINLFYVFYFSAHFCLSTNRHF